MTARAVMADTHDTGIKSTVHRPSYLWKRKYAVSCTYQKTHKPCRAAPGLQYRRQLLVLLLGTYPYLWSAQSGDRKYQPSSGTTGGSSPKGMSTLFSSKNIFYAIILAWSCRHIMPKAGGFPGWRCPLTASFIGTSKLTILLNLHWQGIAGAVRLGQGIIIIIW